MTRSKEMIARTDMRILQACSCADCRSEATTGFTQVATSPGPFVSITMSTGSLMVSSDFVSVYSNTAATLLQFGSPLQASQHAKYHIFSVICTWRFTLWWRKVESTSALLFNFVGIQNRSCLDPNGFHKLL